MTSDRTLRPRTLSARHAKAGLSARPSRLLNTGKKMYLSRETAQRNATESPLLSLPPEIRNRIYRLVIGSHTIHICSSSHYDKDVGRMVLRMGNSVCSADITNEDIAQKIRTAENSFTVQGYGKRHRTCHLGDWSGKRVCISLSLLEVCSQIHKEAALIPFQDNMFAVPDYEIEDFSKRLVPAQRRAINTMSVGCGLGTFSCHLKPRFAGLTRLTVTVHLSEWSDTRLVWMDNNNNNSSSSSTQEIKRRIGFSTTGAGNVASTTVCFLILSGNLSLTADPTYRAVSDELEHALMQAD